MHRHFIFVILFLGCFVFFLGLVGLSLARNPSSDFHNPFQGSQTPIPSPEQIVPKAEPKPLRLLFTGDALFDRTIRRAMNTHGTYFVLEPLTAFFNEFDTVITNLEGPVTKNESISLGSQPGETRNFIFTFDPSILPMLQANNIRVANIGNNHIRNFGDEGVVTTKSFLAQANIGFFGNTGLELQSSERVLVQNFGEYSIGFVNYNQFVTAGLEAGLADIAYLTALRQANEIDHIIVVMHWGNEYQPEANQVIVDQAHSFIDAGADVIIGMHPHVVQQYEMYKGKHIYYSLGNFVFDQYFSDETRTGLLVELRINPDGSINTDEYQVWMEQNGQTRLLQE